MTMEKIQLTKSQKILFILLGIVLAYAIFDFVTHKSTYVSFYSGQENEDINSAQSQQNTAQKQVDPLQTKLFAEWGNDPFLRKTETKTQKRWKKKRRRVNLKLKAISYRSDGSVALINDRIVKQGDVISGYRVISIGAHSVALSNGKRKIVLKLVNR